MSEPLTVILLRHGTALPPGRGADRERALAPGAAAAVTGVARRIAAHVAPDAPLRALVSPARRTMETLDACREALPTIEAERVPAIYEASVDELVGIVAEVDASPLLLIGHNPAITGAAQRMSGMAFTGAMSPADAVIVAYDPATGTERLVERVRAADVG